MSPNKVCKPNETCIPIERQNDSKKTRLNAKTPCVRRYLITKFCRVTWGQSCCICDGEPQLIRPKHWLWSSNKNQFDLRFTRSPVCTFKVNWCGHVWLNGCFYGHWPGSVGNNAARASSQCELQLRGNAATSCWVTTQAVPSSLCILMCFLMSLAWDDAKSQGLHLWAANVRQRCSHLLGGKKYLLLGMSGKWWCNHPDAGRQAVPW